MSFGLVSNRGSQVARKTDVPVIDLCDMDDSASEVEVDTVPASFNAAQYGLMSILSTPNKEPRQCRPPFYQKEELLADDNATVSPVTESNHRPRRNPPRRTNIMPVDYRCMSNILGGKSDSPPPGIGDVVHGGEDVVAGVGKRRKFIPSKKTNPISFSSRNKKAARKPRACNDPPPAGAVYSPPSPLSSLPRRTWPAEGMHDKPIWPNTRYILPERKSTLEEIRAITMHCVLHAVLDYCRMRRDGVTQFYLLDEKIRYIENQLLNMTHGYEENKSTSNEETQTPKGVCTNAEEEPIFKVSTPSVRREYSNTENEAKSIGGTPTAKEVYANVEHEPSANGVALTAREVYTNGNITETTNDGIPIMCAKIRYVLNLMQKSSFEADVDRIMRYLKLPNPSSTVGTVHVKKGLQEVTVVSKIGTYLILEEANEDALLEALLCVTSELYCMTNKVQPDMLADYLDALCKGQK